MPLDREPHLLARARTHHIPSRDPIDDPVERAAADIPYRAEVARKMLHLLALVIPLMMWYLGREWSILLLVPAAAVAAGADLLRARSRGFHAFIERYFGFMMRGTERPPFGGPLVLNGATCVLISAALLAVLFPIEIGAVALAIFMIADAAAALVGRRFGRIRWPRSRRTAEGSIAFIVTAIVLFFLMTDYPLLIILLASGVGAVFEAAPGPLNDNIRVPLIIAAVLYFALFINQFVLT